MLRFAVLLLVCVLFACEAFRPALRPLTVLKSASLKRFAGQNDQTDAEDNADFAPLDRTDEKLRFDMNRRVRLGRYEPNEKSITHYHPSNTHDLCTITPCLCC